MTKIASSCNTFFAGRAAIGRRRIKAHAGTLARAQLVLSGKPGSAMDVDIVHQGAQRRLLLIVSVRYWRLR